MRTIIDIPTEQLIPLDSICTDESISRAEVIRRAIKDYIAKKDTIKNTDIFGIWKDKNIDSITYQNKIRDEWE